MRGAPLRAVVVGAGLAGLAAARRLEQAGASAVVLEARPRPGGSLSSELLDGVEVEQPALIPRCAPRLLALAHALGDAASLVREPLARVALPGARLRSLATRRALGRSPLAGPRLARLQSVAEWLGARLDPAAPERETRLDDRSVSDLCRLYLGRRAHRTLFAPLLGSAFGLDVRETSRQLLFGWLGATGDVELSLVFGLGALVGALAARCADLRTRTRVAALAPAGRGVRLESGDLLAADAVIVSSSAAEVLRLVPDLGALERDILAGFRLRRQTWLALVAEPALRPRARLGWPGGELSALHDVTPPGDATTSRLVLRARPETPPERCLAEAGSLVPGLSRGVRARRALERDLPEYRPGHFRGVARLNGEARRRPERRVYLCSEFMVGPDAEARIVAGERAAEAALALAAHAR